MERNLIMLLKSRDLKAFDTLVSDYEKKIYNYAYSFTKNPEDALDITQEVFLKIHKNISKFNENSTISTWIYKITSNVCIDWARKQKPTVAITTENEDFINQVADKSDSVEGQIQQKEISNEIHHALSLIDEPSRQIVIMRDIQGLTYDEIGQILELESGTVKSRISRSRKKLRDIIVNLRNKNEKISSK